MGTWSEERQVQANAVIAEMETEARDNMTLMPGVHELLAALDAWGLPRGILTRNVTTSVDWLHNMHLRVSACRVRGAGAPSARETFRSRC
jgi:phosphoglycolate phosphatase-like HAD superfamily hydrolase